MFVNQRGILLALGLQSLRENDVLVLFGKDIHHTTPLAVHLFTIETSDRLHHLMLLTFVSCCQ